jgi:hypothetical protein
MKTIQPITIWVNGTNDNATILNLTCVNDNLFNNATFYFQLLDETLSSIASGNLSLIEPDYTTDWTTNDAAYNWAATSLGLTITGEYIQPIDPYIETITETPTPTTKKKSK